MSEVIVKFEKEPSFKPITIRCELVIESREEYDSLRDDVEDGSGDGAMLQELYGKLAGLLGV